MTAMKTLLVALKPLLILTAIAGVTSCSSTKTASGGQYAEYNGGPVNYGSDGAYKPYSGAQPRQAPAATGGYQEFNKPPANAHKATYQAQTSKSNSTTAKKKTVASTSASKTSKTTPKTAKTTSKGQSHVIRHGDTLWGLAKKYHTTVPAIKSANHLTSDVLRDGTTIKIP